MPHCRVQSPGEINVIGPNRATLQVTGVRIPYAILKIVFAKFYFIVFNAVQALTSGGFRIVSDTLVA